MTTNTRAWRWGPLLALIVGTLSSLHCVELPTKSFSCSTDGDCAGLKDPGGATYVCVSGGWCAAPEQPGPGGACTQTQVPPTCSTSNWCWDNPLSEGRPLNTVRGRSATDVWAVGDRGIALHWDGSCWTRMLPGNAQPLRAAWPAAGTTWWFAGAGGTLLRWDGSTWTSQTLAEQLIIHDIEGASDTSAFAVGQSGAIYTFNGQQWSTQPWSSGGTPPDLLAVWPVSNTEAWAVGRGGTLVHGVEGRWSLVNRSGVVDLVAIASGANAGTAYAVGRGLLATYANSAWTGSSYATSSTPLHGVWTSAGVTRLVGPASNIYVLGRSSPEPSGTPQVLNSIWGNDEALWAVGASGTIVRRGETQWSEVPGGVTRTLNGFWGTEDLNLWAAGDNDLLMRRENNLWSPVTPPEQGSFKALWGSGGLLLAATGGGKLLAFKHGQWTQENSGNASTSSVNALWGTGEAPVWAVGDNGALWRRNADASWTDEKLSSERLNGVWGSSASDVWAVGNGGVILHRDASGTWSRQRLPAQTDLFGVWGSGPNDVWAVGNSGAIYHYDGRAWTTIPIQVGTQIFRAVGGRSADSAWAVGDNGTIAFWNGKSWTAQVSGVDEHLRALWVTPSTVWVGGTNGTVLRLQP